MVGADTAWIIVATALVLFMTLPGLALFYGGLVRARNVLSVFMQCYAIACAMSIAWFAFGYSIAFGEGTSGLWGGLGKMFQHLAKIGDRVSALRMNRHHAEIQLPSCGTWNRNGYAAAFLAASKASSRHFQ